MGLKSLRKKLLQDPEFRKEYYNSDDWSLETALIIKEARIKKGLTQKELAKRMGTKQPSIARLENGTSISPSLDFLSRAAKALNINLEPPRLTNFKTTESETYKFSFTKAAVVIPDTWSVYKEDDADGISVNFVDNLRSSEKQLISLTK